jgi:putative ABC transport system permease protein
VQATAGVRHGEGWYVTDGLLPAPPGEAAKNASHQIDKARSDRRVVVIAPPIDTRLLHPRITAGRMLRPGDEDAVVVNSALAARRPETHAGGTLTLQLDGRPVTWRVVGVAREPFSPPTAYVSAAFFAQRRPDAANSLRLALDRTDPESIDAVRGQLDASLAREGIRAMGSLSQAESRTGFDQHMLMIYRFLVVMAAIVAGVGGLGLMTTMSLNVLERRREMGILRAIGATPRTVAAIVAAEALAIAMTAWLLAALIAWPLTRALGNLLASTVFQSGLDVVIDPRGLAIWLAVSVALALAACLLPAWRAARLPVREAISYE